MLPENVVGVAVVNEVAPDGVCVTVRFGVGAGLTVSELEQACVTVCAPEVTVTLAVLAPGLLYRCDMEDPVPVSPSVPVHE
jgi:hypothetical protein